MALAGPVDTSDFQFMDIADDVLGQLDLVSLIRFGCSDRRSNGIATRLAEQWTYAGLQPLQYRGEHCDRILPHWLSSRLALRPMTLFHQECSRPCTGFTHFLPFVLDALGPWFVEFEVTVARAINGAPRVGIVDASTWFSSTELQSRRVARDLSQKSAGSLAVSFSPQCGAVFATWPQQPCDAGRDTYKAHLNWHEVNDASWWWNHPIKAGLLVWQRSLIFYRTNEWGTWHSSGIVVSDLPEQVMPALFLSSFVGFGSVRFAGLRSSPPQVCPCCDRWGHGLFSDWQVWPYQHMPGTDAS